MGRPKISDEERVTTAVRLPATVHERIVALAQELDVSVNYLMTKGARHVIAELDGREERLSSILDRSA